MFFKQLPPYTLAGLDLMTQIPSLFAHRVHGTQAGWPDEFVKKSPQNVAQPIFVKIISLP
jgi:hypothetical protein